VENDGLRDSISIDGMSNDDAILYLMRRYGEEIKRMVYMFVKNWQQSEAITQDIFVTMYVELDTFRMDDTALRGWIYSIVIRKTKVFRDSWTYRKQKFMGKPNSSFRKNVSESEDRLLYDVVLDLPIKYREVIVLHFYCQFSVEEISQLLKLRHSKVTLRLNRGKKLMQKSLETLGGEFSWEII
jgi:RNA polymerase sigma-70 factor, ECF subfamily